MFIHLEYALGDLRWEYMRLLSFFNYRNLIGLYTSNYVFIVNLQVHTVHSPANAPHSSCRLRRVRGDRRARALRLLHDARRHRAVQRAPSESAQIQVVQERALATYGQ